MSKHMFVLIPAAPSSPPVNLSFSELKSRSFHLSWEPPLVENINGIIRKYIVNITEQLTGSQEILETLSTNLNIHSLHPYTTYLASVSAFTVDRGPFTQLEILTLEDGKVHAGEFV